MKNIPIKKIIKVAGIVLGIFVLGGLGGVYFEQSVLPKIRTNQFLSRVSFLQRVSENVTVINKTEQIVVQENDSITQLVSQPATAVVEIVSINTNAKIIDPELMQREGSGVIVTSDGMIVTYRTSILENNAKYGIITNDGGYFDAQLVGIDEFTNLAYLKIDTGSLPVVTFANSDEYYAGKKLIAIAHGEIEYQNTFATGLLSSYDPNFSVSGKIISSTEKMDGVYKLDFINDEIYIGAPVVSHSGAVIGIIGSAVIDNQQRYFVIPANILKKSLDRAVRGELKELPVFGAYYVPLTKAYSAAHGLVRDSGALVYSPSGRQGLAVLAGSVAESAGIRVNDIITSVNGQEVTQNNLLANLLYQFKKGDSVDLKVVRDEKEISIKVEL